MVSKIISHYFTRFEEPTLKTSHFNKRSPTFRQNQREKCGSWASLGFRSPGTLLAIWHAGFQTSFFVNSFINAAFWCAPVVKGAAQAHESADSGGLRLHSGRWPISSLSDFIAEILDEPALSGRERQAERLCRCSLDVRTLVAVATVRLRSAGDRGTALVPPATLHEKRSV